MTKTLIIDDKVLTSIGASMLTALAVLGEDPHAMAIFEALRTVELDGGTLDLTTL